MPQLMYGLSRGTAVADSPPGLCPAICAVMDAQSVSSCANLLPHKCATPIVNAVLEDSIQDCLEKLNLTMLISLFTRDDELQDRLTDQDRDTTVFAPSEEALMNADGDMTMLNEHIVNGLHRSGKLHLRHRLPTLAAGHFIQITSVRVSGGRIAPYLHVCLSLLFVSQSSGHSRRLFVNGVEVVMGDACLARNGVVHVINGVIMSSNRSLAEVLANTPEVSSFTQLVRKANLNSLLERASLLTVFAPSNDAIDENLMTCLCRSENRHLLQKVVKFHLVSGAEYNSTLQLRRCLYPKSCGYHRGWWWWRRRCYPISVSVEHGEVTVADSVITDTDIAASNGVIHITSRVLNNPKLNLATRCPPPTTPPTTSSSPTTTEPTTSPTTPPTNSSSPTTTEPTTSPTNSPTPTRPRDEDLDLA